MTFPVCGCRNRPENRPPWLIRFQKERDQRSRAPELVTNLLERISDDQIAIDALVRFIDGDLARRDFADFCRQAWHVTDPTTPLLWNWHHTLVCRVLQGMFEDWQEGQKHRKFKQKVVRSIFNLPPGSTKSRIISVFFMCWAWVRDPSVRFICLSVNEAAALRDARAAREVLKSTWFQETFQPKWWIRSDQDAISNFGNSEKGERVSRASGSEIVGLRGSCLAGESAVSTEHGDVSIATLHEMFALGNRVPRVWAFDHDTNTPVLRGITASRRIADRGVVDVKTNTDNVLRCTDDHRIFSEGEYAQAASLTGRGVSVLSDMFDDGVDDATVLSVDPATIDGCCIKVDVYDLQVDGCHNFFANGILVHNCLILDDPNNPLESENKIERDKVNMLWDTNQRSRVNDPLRSLVIDVQQRTHEEDLTGHLLKTEGAWHPTNNPRGWLQVALPGEFEPERRCITPWGDDPRTIPGESIHPERFPVEWLAKERELFREQYAGQWQQRPTQQGGGTIQSKWWGFFRLEHGVQDTIDEHDTGRPRPVECDQKSETQLVKAAHHRPGHWEFDSITISVDPANQRTETGSNWGVLVIGKKGIKSYILDDGTRRGDWADILDGTLVPMIRLWRPDRLLVEAKAAGPSLLTGFRKALEQGVFKKEDVDFARVVIETVTPDAGGGKEDRLKSVSPYLKNGLVFVRDGAPWLGEFIQEMELFPNASRDDRVDSLSQYLAHQMAESSDWADW